MKQSIHSLAPLTLMLFTHYLSYAAAPTTNQPDLNNPTPIVQQQAVVTEDDASISAQELEAGPPTNTESRTARIYNPTSLQYLAAQTIIRTLATDMHSQNTAITPATPSSPTWAQEMSGRQSKAPSPNIAQRANRSHAEKSHKKEKAPLPPQSDTCSKRIATIPPRTYPIKPGTAPLSPFKLDQKNQRVPEQLYAYLDFLYEHFNFAQPKKIDQKNRLHLNRALCAAANNTTLFGSIKQKLIIDLITDGAEINTHSQDVCQRTPLLIAAQNGDVHTIKTLLDYGADTNHLDRSDWTALINAARNGHTQAVFTLIDHGIDPNQENPHGWTALLAAAQKGHLSVVEALCALPNVNRQQANKLGENALMWAARNGHVETVHFLMHCADTDINHINSNNWTALSAAAHFQHNVTVQKLLTHADINPNHADNEGITPLMWAVLHNNDAMVQLLLAAPGIMPNIADGRGRTALSTAKKIKNKKIIALLEHVLSRD